MNEAGPGLADRATALRRGFDLSFAAERQPDSAPREDFLGIRLQDEPYAIRLSEISGLFACQQIAPVPSDIPALLGLAGFRGAVVPVYDLNNLLGHSRSETTRWLAIAAGTPVALAFDVFDGHIRVFREAIVARASNDISRQHVREFARTANLVRPIVHIPSVLDAIGARAAENARRQEQ
jgi:purine-binding chemotaxis protein CheW